MIKAAYDREKKAEADKSSGGWPKQSIAIGVIVLRITAYNLYLRYRKKDDIYPVVYKEPPPPPPNTPEVKTSKIGMQ